MIDQTERYLSALYRNCTEGHVVLAHNGKDRHAILPISDLGKIADEIRRAPLDMMIKFNVLDGEAIMSRGEYAVGGKAEVLYVVAMAADIDVGKGKYASFDETLVALGDMPLAPSIVVQTKGPGSGLHAYWLLNHPTPPSDRTDSISERWQQVLRSKLSPKPLDATHDRSRFLRPPGATRDNGAVVSIVQLDESRRYTLEDFEPHLPEAEPEVVYEPCDAGDKVIGQHLDERNITVERLLAEGGWTPDKKAGFWNRPGASSGAPSGEIFRSKRTRELGITIKSGGAELPPGWYSRDTLWVEQNFSGDWKQAARAVHEWNESKLQEGDISAPQAAQDSQPSNPKRKATESASDILDDYLDELDRGEGDVLFSVGDCFGDFELGPGLITLIGAPPGTGKTALAMQMAFTALEIQTDLTATICNAESSIKMLLRREICRRTDINPKKLRFGDLTQFDRKLIADTQEQLRASTDRMRAMQPPFSIDGLRQIGDELAPGILVVDYLQKFAPPGDPRSGVNEVIGQLRLLAANGWAVLALSATTRNKSAAGAGHDSQKLSLASFKESGELEFNDDAAYLLREGETQGATREITLDCVKNRNGETTSTELLFTMNRMMFSSQVKRFEEFDQYNDDPFAEVASA